MRRSGRVREGPFGKHFVGSPNSPPLAEAAAAWPRSALQVWAASSHPPSRASESQLAPHAAFVADFPARSRVHGLSRVATRVRRWAAHRFGSSA